MLVVLGRACLVEVDSIARECRRKILENKFYGVELRCAVEVERALISLEPFVWGIRYYTTKLGKRACGTPLYSSSHVFDT